MRFGSARRVIATALFTTALACGHLCGVISPPRAASACTVPYVFSDGNSLPAAQLNLDFSTLATCIATANTASAIIPTSTETATFGGAFDYTMPVGLRIGGAGGARITSGAGPPSGACSVGDQYFNTAQNPLQYHCTAVNTWTPVGYSTTWPATVPAGQTLVGFGNSIIEQGNTTNCSGSTHALTTPPNSAGTCYFDLVATSLGFAASIDLGLGGSTLQHCTPGSDCPTSGIDRYSVLSPYTGQNYWLIVDYTANDANLTGIGGDFANFSPANYQANLTTILKAENAAGIPGDHMIVCDGSFVDPLYFVSANPWIFQYAAASANAVLAVPGARLADCYSAIALNGGVSLLVGSPGTTRIHPTDAGSPYIATAIKNATTAFASAMTPVANFLASAATNPTIINSLQQTTFNSIQGANLFAVDGPAYTAHVSLASGWIGSQQNTTCGGVGLGGTSQVGFLDFGCTNAGAWTFSGSGGDLYFNKAHLTGSPDLNSITFPSYASSALTSIYSDNTAGVQGVNRGCLAIDAYAVTNLFALDCSGNAGFLASVSATEFIGSGAGLTGIPANQFAAASFTSGDCAQATGAAALGTAGGPCVDTVTAQTIAGAKAFSTTPRVGASLGYLSPVYSLTSGATASTQHDAVGSASGTTSGSCATFATCLTATASFSGAAAPFVGTTYTCSAVNTSATTTVAVTLGTKATGSVQVLFVNFNTTSLATSTALSADVRCTGS